MERSCSTRETNPHTSVTAEVGAARPPVRPRAVFVSDSVVLSRPFRELEPVFADREAAWLGRLGAVTGAVPGAGAQPELDASIARGVLRIGPGRAAQPMAVVVGQPRSHPGAVIVAMGWYPLTFGQLLPRLEADLEAARLDGLSTRISVSGSYRVPFGAVGLGMDRLGLHRVAEAGVRQFLRDLQRALVPGGEGSAVA
jgi:D-serine deaminase-like pyridoxal phosphate-dependent protein